MPKLCRKFECGCGWKSSSFGHRRYIDEGKLRIAQAQLHEHLKESPGCCGDPAVLYQPIKMPQKLTIIFEPEEP